MTKCGSCGAENPDGKKYCGDCGVALAPDHGDDATVRAIVKAVLAERYADQKLIEIETSQAIVARLAEWGKLFGFFVGVPLAVLALVLAVLSISNFADLSRVISKGKADLGAQVTTAKKQVGRLNTERDEIDRRFGDLRTRLSQTEQLADQVDELRDRLSVLGAKAPAQAGILAGAVQKFANYLAQIGYAGKLSPVNIAVMKDLSPGSIAYYDPSKKTIFVQSEYASNFPVLYREYMHHVLYDDNPKAGNISDGNYMYVAIESAVATYIPCSYQNDPRATGGIWDLTRSQHRLGEVRDVQSAITVGTEFWGNAFWEVRSLLGAKAFDSILYTAWRSLEAKASPDQLPILLARRLVDLSPTDKRADVAAIFRRRGVAV